MENVLDAHTRALLERGETPPETDLQHMTPFYQKLGGYRRVSKVSTGPSAANKGINMAPLLNDTTQVQTLGVCRLIVTGFRCV